MEQVIKAVELSWEKDTPLSQRHEDYYFSLKNGLEESHYVFLLANHLPSRFAGGNLSQPFVVVETGFGTGLNFLATWRAWQNIVGAKRPLHFISIEKYPLTKVDINKCLNCWPELADFSAELIECYPNLIPGQHQIHFHSGEIRLTLIFGDVNTDLAKYGFEADCWFLDGFSPSKNPSMWTEQLFSLMAERSNENTTFSTFTAASLVRRWLEKAGFSVRKRPGFGAKREMIAGSPG